MSQLKSVFLTLKRQRAAYSSRFYHHVLKDRRSFVLALHHTMSYAVQTSEVYENTFIDRLGVE